MKTRTVLHADEGMILTDGTHYGRIVYLAPDDDGSAWHEIPKTEYEENIELEKDLNDIR